MKKLFAAFTAVVFMLSASLTAQAGSYNVTVSGMQCYASVSSTSVFAYTSASGTVTINSTAYNSANNSVGGNGNAANGYASVNYAASNIHYAVQTHTQTSTGVSETRRQYAQ
ncbi:MAG: hypothetical protein HDQ98_10165 [Lachnospiraceae bacterium]|nr:hypothetical protein [Lachnospiraceae bacterium]